MGCSASSVIPDDGPRNLSLPAPVRLAGGIEKWNNQSEEYRMLSTQLASMCQAGSVEQVLAEVKAVRSIGSGLWAYAYMRTLYAKNHDLYYRALMAHASELLPVVYTPTVGEACQKFGTLPFSKRGCYISIDQRGFIKKVLREYAQNELRPMPGKKGQYECDCIVFSDGGRILGLGDLGAWGMGIPIGKLDLYTVCAGVDPGKTIPVIIDAGCADQDGNTDKCLVRDHPMYTGLKRDRDTTMSSSGTKVNSAYYGKKNMIKEFMDAAVELFGKGVLLQFEDFNSNDAFPLLAECRNNYVTYNDDIQGTAAVAVAALMGATKLRKPSCTNLVEELRKQRFLFHGSGSANLGTMKLLCNEAGVPKENLFATNSRGLIWKEEGGDGSYRNEEQKEFAVQGKPQYECTQLTTIIENIRPLNIVGAVGVSPGCFDKDVVSKIMEANERERPGLFALSNPKHNAEITASDAYQWSKGGVIYGSGTQFDTVELNGKVHSPGQVNNVYIFPGVSFGVVCCQAKSIPERLFMVAAEAVANSLSEEDIREDRVVPHASRLREVGLNVAAAVVMEAQRLRIACVNIGTNEAEIKAVLKNKMWEPPATTSILTE